MECLIVTIIAGVFFYNDIITTEVFLACVAAGFIWTYGAAALYFKTGFMKFYYHGLLKWHTPNEDETMWDDGLSVHCKCKYCGKDIMHDSQGNWFTFEED